jgi:hypothetical protein
MTEITGDDPRKYRKNRGGFSVVVKGKSILHLDVEYYDDAMTILRSYKILMWYLKQRKGAFYSWMPNKQLHKEFCFFEPFVLYA